MHLYCIVKCDAHTLSLPSSVKTLCIVASSLLLESSSCNGQESWQFLAACFTFNFAVELAFLSCEGKESLGGGTSCGRGGSGQVTSINLQEQKYIQKKTLEYDEKTHSLDLPYFTPSFLRSQRLKDTFNRYQCFWSNFQNIVQKSGTCMLLV